MASCINNMETSLVARLPLSIFNSDLSTKEKINLCFQHICVADICSLDKVIRAIICRDIRERKEISLRDLPNLLIMALCDIKIETFDLPLSSIANELANKNRMENLLDMGTKIVSQMMTHLPKDISEFVSADIRLAVFKLFIANLTNINGQVKENFSLVPTDLLNASILSSNNVLIDRTLYEVLSPQIIKEEKKKKIILPQDLDGIRLVEADISNLNLNSNTNTKPSISLPKDMSSYVEIEPELRVGQDINSGNVEFYYYDKLSNSLLTLPSENSIPIKKEVLENLLKTTNLSAEQLGDYIGALTTTNGENNNTNINSKVSSDNTTLTTLATIQPSTNTIIQSENNTSSSSKDYTWIILGSLVGFLVLVGIIVGVVYYFRKVNENI
jgi:hypothetical protein